MTLPNPIDPRQEELQAEHIQVLKDVRLKLCEIADDPLTGVRPYYASHQAIMDIVEAIEKLLGVR